MDVGTGCGGAMGETWEMEVSVCEGGGWGMGVSDAERSEIIARRQPKK